MFTEIYLSIFGPIKKINNGKLKQIVQCIIEKKIFFNIY